MMHYLAITHETYDSSTVFGVFDTIYAARDHIEAVHADTTSDLHYPARDAVIEEWDGSEQIATYERDWSNPKLWRKSA